MEKEKLLSWTRTTFLMLVSSFLIAFAAYALIAPNEFTVGGAGGMDILAVIIQRKVGATSIASAWAWILFGRPVKSRKPL